MKRLILIFLLLSVSGLYADLTTGLVAYYKLEDTTATTGGQNLTNNGTVTFSAGKLNNAANFVSASSQYLIAADNAIFHMGTSTNFTIACWVKFTIGTEKSIFTYGGYPVNSYGIWTHGGVIMGVFINNSPAVTNTSQATGACNDGSWHLVAVTYDRAGNMTIHVDNDTGPSGFPNSTDISAQSAYDLSNSIGLMIGADESTPTNFFDGSVDNLAIWSRILSAGDLSELWNGGAGVEISGGGSSTTTNPRSFFFATP